MSGLPGNLIPERTPFIGRKAERRALFADLKGRTRLLTITGPSGTGKTTLARRLARDAAPCFAGEGGAWFCSLAGCSDERDVEAAVARVLGVPQVQGQELASAIASRGDFLLVLDNLEPVARQAAPLLERWLDHCPRLQILVTSLVPTGVHGEVRFELGPLATEDAVALYLESVRRAWANRVFADAEREVVEELVQRLDRLPLAIELAAARARVLPPRQLLARISERLTLLSSDRGGNHGSLARALSLSWELLSEAEKRALARASVFAGGFSLEAAEALLTEGAGEPALQVLDGLRDKALVQLEDEEGELPRFTLYESVRDFAALQLEAAGETEALRDRHAAFFTAAAEPQAARLDGPEGPAAIRWMLAERDNLLAAFRWSLERDAVAASRLGHCLSLLLAYQGPASLGFEVLEGALAAARRSGDPRAVARALWSLGRACKRHGRPEEALAALEEGLELARACGDRLREGYILVEIWAVRLPTAARAKGVAELEKAIRIGKEAEDPLLEGIARMMRGVWEEHAGASPATVARFREALALFRRIGNLRYQGVALLNLGAVHSHLGAFQLARQALAEARGVFRSLANPASENYVLVNEGSVELTAGRLDEAEAHLREAHGRARAFGNRLLEALSIGGLGVVALERGDAREAEVHLAAAVAILAELGDERQQATQQSFLAVCAARLGRVDEARRSIAQAEAAFEAVKDKGSLAALRLLSSLVDLAAADEAETPAEEARALVTRARGRLDEAWSHQGPIVESFFVARRLLAQALKRWDDAPDEAAAALVVGPDAAWFQVRAGPTVDLRRRGAIRRILQALVEQRLEAPGEGLSQQALFDVGWPGERVLPEAAAARVYTAIRTLRSLGLAEALLRHADGYLLDPELPAVRSAAPQAGKEEAGPSAA